MYPPMHAHTHTHRHTHTRTHTHARTHTRTHAHAHTAHQRLSWRAERKKIMRKLRGQRQCVRLWKRERKSDISICVFFLSVSKCQSAHSPVPQRPRRDKRGLGNVPDLIYLTALRNLFVYQIGLQVNPRHNLQLLWAIRLVLKRGEKGQTLRLSIFVD